MSAVAQPPARKRYTLAKAREWSAQIVSQLSPYCHRIEVAGSIRRGDESIGDLNLVCLPKDRAGVRARVCQSKPEVIVETAAALVVRLGNGFILDLSFCEASRRTSSLTAFHGSNFGSQLLFLTGSHRHNAFLHRRAQNLGMRWNPAFGIYLNGRLLAADSEDDIFEALGLECVAPEERSNF